MTCTCIRTYTTIHYTYKVTFLTSGKIWIYLKIVTNWDTLGGVGESGIKINSEIMKWESFSDKLSKTVLHAREVYGALSEVLYFTEVSSWNSSIDYRKISAWAALVHSSIGIAPLVLRVCKIFLDCLSKKGPRFSIWASILMQFSPHHPKISCFINIVK